MVIIPNTTSAMTTKPFLLRLAQTTQATINEMDQPLDFELLDIFHSPGG